MTHLSQLLEEAGEDSNAKDQTQAKHKKIIIKNTSVSDHWPALLCILSEEAAGSGKNP